MCAQRRNRRALFMKCANYRHGAGAAIDCAAGRRRFLGAALGRRGFRHYPERRPKAEAALRSGILGDFSERRPKAEAALRSGIWSKNTPNADALRVVECIYSKAKESPTILRKHFCGAGVNLLRRGTAEAPCGRKSAECGLGDIGQAEWRARMIFVNCTKIANCIR